MAKINVTSGTASAYGQGELQLQNKAPMDSTLRFVTDSANTASPLKLSTSLVQTTSTLKITTNDNPYIDAEDGAGNNRFTVGRDTGSQQVNVDFASNPGGSTTIVGAFRTYVDGVNLSEVMAFREDGNIGINTLTPGAKLDIHSASNVIAQINRTGAGKSWFQYLQAGTARWNTGYDNTNGNFTIYDAVNAADRMVVTNAGNVGIGTSTPTYKLQVDIADTTAYDSTNTLSAQPVAWLYNNTSTAGVAATLRLDGGLSGGNGAATISGVHVGSGSSALTFGTRISNSNVIERMRIDASGNVGIGVTPSAWSSGYKVIQGSYATSYGLDQNVPANLIVSNAYNDGTSWKYGITAPAAKLNVVGWIGAHTFEVAASGTAGSPLTWLERVRIDNDGLKFNGDTAAANALDDYEEGTWTPVYYQGGVPNTATYTYQLGTYTKIGNLVTAFFDVDASSITAGAGACELYGLPFTIGNSMAGYSYVPFRDPSALATILTNAIGIGFTQRLTTYVAIRQISTVTGQETGVSSWFTSGRLTGVFQYTVG